MKGIMYFILPLLILLLGCDSGHDESGSRLFDSLTGSSEYKDYLAMGDVEGTPALLCGRVTSMKSGSEYPVYGASVTLSSKSSTVTNTNGYYCLKNIYLTDSGDGEVTQETVTLSVSAQGYTDSSNTITIRKGQAFEIDVMLTSSYSVDNPGGSIRGLVRNKYTHELLNSMEVTILGEMTLTTGADNYYTGAGKGEFYYPDIYTGDHAISIIDPSGYYRDYNGTVSVSLGLNSHVFEMTPSQGDTEEGSLTGIVKTEDGDLLGSIEVILDGKYTDITDSSGWFELKYGVDSTIPSGSHVITATPHSSYLSSTEVTDYSSTITIYPGENLEIISLTASSS